MTVQFLAKVRTEIRCPIVGLDAEAGEFYTHVCRGVPHDEYDRILEEGRRAGVDDVPDDDEAAKAAARAANTAAWFEMWRQIVRRVEGYGEQVDALAGEDLERFFRAEGEHFAGMDPDEHAIVRDLLAGHVRTACQSWIAQNTARWSFRLADPSSRVGPAA